MNETWLECSCFMKNDSWSEQNRTRIESLSLAMYFGRAGGCTDKSG